jgi:hypothetical protein
VPPFISYAQNREDVVLFRAVGHVSAGRYVEVGAGHPTEGSATRALYDRGWAGITIESDPQLADLHREQRPRDMLVDSIRADDLDSALSMQSGDTEFHLLLDLGGAAVGRVDLRRWRPWVLVIGVAAPDGAKESWEADVLAAGYQFRLFDGMSRFYVADEHAAELGPALGYPACARDHYETHAEEAALRTVEELLAETTHWRTTALSSWAEAVTEGVAESAEAERLADELAAMQQTLSWRVTRPLRGVRQILARSRRDDD